MLEKDVDIWAGVAPVAVLVSCTLKDHDETVMGDNFPFISLKSITDIPPSTYVSL